MSGELPKTAAASVREWNIAVVARYTADTPAEAEQLAQQLMDHVLEHPQSIEARAWCEEETHDG